MSVTTAKWLFIAFAIGFAVKIPLIPVPHLAARRAHRRAHRRLGRAGRRAAQDGHLRLLALRDPDVPASGGRPRADPARARRDRHHLRRHRRRDATEPEAHHRVLVRCPPRLRRARRVRAHERRHLGRAVHDALARPHHRRVVPARRHALRPPPHVRADGVPRPVEGGARVRRAVRRRDVRVDRPARLLGLRGRVPVAARCVPHEPLVRGGCDHGRDPRRRLPALGRAAGVHRASPTKRTRRRARSASARCAPWRRCSACRCSSASTRSRCSTGSSRASPRCVVQVETHSNHKQPAVDYTAERMLRRRQATRSSCGGQYAPGHVKLHDAGRVK